MSRSVERRIAAQNGGGDMSDTPLTDAEEEDVRNLALYWDTLEEACEQYAVKSSFARTLERQLAAMTAKRDSLVVCRDHWKTSYQHERANVIRLRHELWMSHSHDCKCRDCQLVDKTAVSSPSKQEEV